MSFDTFWHKHQSNNAIILNFIAQCKMFPHLPYCFIPLKSKSWHPYYWVKCYQKLFEFYDLAFKANFKVYIDKTSTTPQRVSYPWLTIVNYWALYHGNIVIFRGPHRNHRNVLSWRETGAVHIWCVGQKMNAAQCSNVTFPRSRLLILP